MLWQSKHARTASSRVRGLSHAGSCTTGGFEFWIQDTGTGDPVALERVLQDVLKAARARHELTGYSVAVGNSGAYGGGMYLLPHALLDDGELDVLMSGDTSKLTFLRSLPKVFKGTHLDSPHAHVLRGREIELQSDRPFVIYADGDPIAATPATVTVEPRCLRVIVPAAAS